MELFNQRNWKRLIDKENPFSFKYETNEGNIFYVEPGFYSQLEAIYERDASIVPLILDQIEIIANKNKYVVFTLDFLHPLTKVEGYVFREMKDITNPLSLYFINRSNRYNKAE
jgi:hypothetical protein